MNFDTLFPDIRETGDTRLRQCQLVMLRMLKILDFLCKKNDISYFLNGGTLLGAIRHKGFIPWDDDLDIGMTRNNYEKFVKYAVPELPYDIFFQSDETDPYFPACHIIEAKLRDKYSSYSRTIDQKETWLKWQDGLQIDIAVFDRAYLPSNVLIAVLNRTLTFLFHRKGNAARAKALKWIERYLPYPKVFATSFINGRKMIKEGLYYIRHEEVATLVKADFEDIQSYIPVGWHKYLTRRYGNYMQPPPPEMRKIRHGVCMPDPFTPSQHSEILQWKERNQLHLNRNE
jgi:lipopolysaccharide cholinephosphotransferase